MSETFNETVDREIEALSNLGERLIDSIIADEPMEIIIKMINSDAPLWYQNDAEGMSSLHAAAYQQDTELARLLIERGAIWNAGKLIHISLWQHSIDFSFV